MLTKTMESKLAALERQLRDMHSVVVAFSGGLDSAFVLAIAHRTLGPRAIGLTAFSPSVPQRERSAAARIAHELGARHIVAESRELNDPSYTANGNKRCFYCKSELYKLTDQLRRELGFQCVANGTNLDDLGEGRPSLQAAAAAGVRSPLVEAELHKAEIRTLARELELSFWNKPSATCLSTRIPYGTPITKERLAQVERLEDALLMLGLCQVRVRHHDTVACIEVVPAELEAAFRLRDVIIKAGQASGFAHVALDLAGDRRGPPNAALPILR